MGKIELPLIHEEYEGSNCRACNLNQDSRLLLYGQGKRRILIVFEAQDAIQQSLKSYGCGYQYEFVRDVLYKYGIVVEEDCWITSTIQCYTKSIEDKHATHCAYNLTTLMGKIKPLLVIGFGEYTAKTLFSDVIHDRLYLDRVHGFVRNNRKVGCNIVCTYTPQKSLYSTASVDTLRIQRDIHIAIMSLKQGYKTWKDEKECIHTLSEKDAVTWLKQSVNNDRERWGCFDIETTGLKPYNESSKVLSCGIAEAADEAVAFQITPDTRTALIDWLKTPQIKKLAHNSAFERLWCRVKFGMWVKNFHTDTMLLMHLLDNRESGCLSIKFLAPVLLGCERWDTHISPYMEPEASDKALNGEYACNKLHLLPIKQLLTYNAMDAVTEYRVMMLLYRYLNTYEYTFPSEESIERYHV